MKKILFYSTLLILAISCRNRDYVFKPNEIEVNGQTLGIDNANTEAVTITAGVPQWTNISVKIKCDNGAFIYLYCSNTKKGIYEYHDTYDETIKNYGTVNYHGSSDINSQKLNTSGANSGYVEILEFDSINQKISLRFDVKVFSPTENFKIQGEVKDVKYEKIQGYHTKFTVSAKRNGEEWNYPELGSYNHSGRILLNTIKLGELAGQDAAQLNIDIPWGTEKGVYILKPSDAKILFYGSNDPKWEVKSGQIDIENIDFSKGEVSGKFNVTFQYVDNHDFLTEFTEGVFEVSHQF
jgi:hypothetical protein